MVEGQLRIVNPFTWPDSYWAWSWPQPC